MLLILDRDGEDIILDFGLKGRIRLTIDQAEMLVDMLQAEIGNGDESW